MIAGKTLLQRVHDAVKDTNLFQRIVIATDHPEIFDHAKTLHCEVMMTSPDHISGSDRIAECARQIQTDIIINVQGDEPFIDKEPLQKLITAFDDKDIQVASLMHIITDKDDIKNPNAVKVVVDKQNFAIYFSRATIPYIQPSTFMGASPSPTYYKHIGVYGYRPEMLQEFVSLPHGTLEKIEKLEQLRLLENNIKIKMIETQYTGIGIDTKEDIEKAEKKINER